MTYNPKEDRILIIWFVILVMLWAFALWAMPVHAHHIATPHDLLSKTGNCYEILIGDSKPVAEQTLPNGLIIKRYDLVGHDGHVDTVTNTPAGAKYPWAYIRDMDLDGVPDVAYRDVGGEGLCKDFVIQEYQLSTPSNDKVT